VGIQRLELLALAEGRDDFAGAPERIFPAGELPDEGGVAFEQLGELPLV
jgi:hypothetical protein